MPQTSCKTSSIDVYARWRPTTVSELASGEIGRDATSDSRPKQAISINCKVSSTNRPWTSPSAFTAVFDPKDDNAQVFDTIVEQVIPKVLSGGNCSFFAYGHSGSGKTHTIIGYDDESKKEHGLCLIAAKRLFEALRVGNNESTGRPQLGIGFSLFELRKKSAYDLLNKRTECHVREGYNGKTHIRGKTEILEGGKVRVCPIVQRACWDFESFQKELVQAIGNRSVGSSSIHDQSSRTHAVLELELICQELVDARLALVDRQSELVPVAKRATDISIEEQSKSVIRTPDGGWAPNPEKQVNQGRIDEVEAEKAEFDARVTAAEEDIDNICKTGTSWGLGGKMVFVDLAGAEYQKENASQSQIFLPKQTPQERQEGRQINTDLLALKEVMRSWSQRQPRIPFRSSTLTMVLREHFTHDENGMSAMIVTLSPSEKQYAATLNSLKYGSLVGASSPTSGATSKQ